MIGTSSRLQNPMSRLTMNQVSKVRWVAQPTHKWTKQERIRQLSRLPKLRTSRETATNHKGLTIIKPIAREMGIRFRKLSNSNNDREVSMEIPTIASKHKTSMWWSDRVVTSKVVLASETRLLAWLLKSNHDRSLLRSSLHCFRQTIAWLKVLFLPKLTSRLLSISIRIGKTKTTSTT